MENIFAVHWSSTDGFEHYWFCPWASMSIHEQSTDSPFTISGLSLDRVKGDFPPLSSLSVHWRSTDSPLTVSGPSVDCLNNPPELTGRNQSVEPVHRMLRSAQGQCFVFLIYNYTLYHLHSVHSGFFLEIFTWMIWTMLCIKCRNKYVIFIVNYIF